MNQPSNNTITLCGAVAEEPIYSHEVFGENFFSLMFTVKRLSGQEDVLPVIISERLMAGEDFPVGKRFSLDGQLRSYNLVCENKSRLRLHVFVREFYPVDECAQDENKVVLNGYVCKPPVYRVTPFEREISDVLIAVNRAYGKSDYIPCICWGRNARYCEQIVIGDGLKIEGRLQSRTYQKKMPDESVIERVAYEVSAAKLFLSKKSSCTN